MNGFSYAVFDCRIKYVQCYCYRPTSRIESSKKIMTFLDIIDLFHLSIRKRVQLRAEGNLLKNNIRVSNLNV